MNLNQVKILIVDDQGSIRSLLRQMLAELGAQQIYDAVDGQDGWEKLSAVSPDIVIVDWEMKPVNGLQFTRRVRNDPNSPNPFVPVIMLTGHSEPGRVVAARNAGANEFVVKPVTVKALVSRIVSLIENPRSFVRTDKFFGPDRRRREMHYPEERRGLKNAEG
jgi:two-component system, chemotaxis family, chemotaxis protein CheY